MKKKYGDSYVKQKNARAAKMAGLAIATMLGVQAAATIGAKRGMSRMMNSGPSFNPHGGLL